MYAKSKPDSLIYKIHKEDYKMRSSTECCVFYLLSKGASGRQRIEFWNPFCTLDMQNGVPNANGIDRCGAESRWPQ